MRTRTRLGPLALLAACLFALPAAAQLQRIELHAVPSVTLSGDEFLTGSSSGKPVTLSGELRLPVSGAAKVPAVVLVHGSGGLGASTDRWAWEINSAGAAAFILDSFAGRGIVETATDQSRLNSLAMMVDAYRALGLLAEHPRIDRTRIAVMGFSKGAVAAIYSSNERFRKLYAPADLAFAAHIGLYTPCNVRYRDDDKVTGSPMRFFHGIADDYVSIAPCRDYVARLKLKGVDVTLTEYEGAYHAYDVFTITAPIRNPKSQTTRNCFLEEGEGGTILNSKTGQPYTLADPCVELGPQVAYNEAAHKATVAAVKEFLAASLKLP